MTHFKMPALGADMEKGTVIEWRVKPGQNVERGQIVAEVETEKGVMEVEIWNTGTIGDILVPAGSTVPVGTPLAVVLEPAEARRSETVAVTNVPAALEPLQAVEAAHARMDVPEWSAREKQSAPLAAEAASRAQGRPPAATPLARRIAQEYDLDLLQIKGTGPHGAITREDVESAAHIRAEADRTAPRPHKEQAEIAPLATAADDMHRRLEMMRQAIARSMERSKKEIPHYYLKTELDAAALLRELDQINVNRSVVDRVLPIAAIVRAIALAARKVPAVNGFWQDGRFQAADGVHVGLAVSLKGGGLIAPALMDCDKKTAQQIQTEILDLVARARRGKLRGSEMTAATLTVTSLGDQGVDEVYGVIYPPQVALVGVGTIRSRPWAKGEFLGVQPTLTLTLSGDHRASDGHTGGNFLREIQRSLEQPESSGLF